VYKAMIRAISIFRSADVQDLDQNPDSKLDPGSQC
jgi:hypothetical protein